jgi:multiple sugar transport system ATP-binding protein
MPFLELKQVEKSFGAQRAIKSIDLQVEKGEFVVFVGPSGCGKSTLLRLIAGLESIDAGALILEGRDITRLAAAKRDLAMVFQSYALYPHMTVAENMSFALRLAKVDTSIVGEKVKRDAEILNLTSYLERTPKELSGGQRQRVAIGRAIVRSPRVFLFDEPLSNLDAALRGQTRVEIAKLHRELGATTIYVTHDQVEAMTMADRVVVLRDGAIEQVGSPLELYDHPANRFVAQFIGTPKMNIVESAALPALAAAAGAPAGGPGFIGVRPEHVLIRPSGQGPMPARVELIESLGADTLIYCQARAGGPAPGGEVQLVARLHERTHLKTNDVVALDIEPGMYHRFNEEGRAVERAA